MNFSTTFKHLSLSYNSMVCKAAMHLVMLKSVVSTLVALLLVPLLYLSTLANNALVLARDVFVLAFDVSA